MKRLFKNKSILYKYLASYLLILSITIITLSFTLYNNAANALKNEIDDYTLDRMQKIKTIFDDRVKKTLKTAVAISQDDRFKSDNALQNEYSSLIAIQQLKNYWDSTFVDFMFIYFNNSGYIYSLNGAMTLDTLFNYRLDMDPAERQKFENILKNNHAPLISGFSTGGSRNLVCFYPLPYGNKSPYGEMALFVKEDIFKDITGDLLGSSEGAVFIVTKEMEAIFSIGNEKFASNDQIKSIISKDHTESISNINFENTKLSIINVFSPETGLKYVAVMSHDKYIYKIMQIQWKFFYVALIVVLLGIIISLYLARQNYRPIKNLLDSTSKYFTEMSREKCNEIEHIKNSFDVIIKRNLELNEHFKFNKSFFKEQIIFMLLKGQISGKEKVKELLELYEMHFEYEYMIVATISINSVKNCTNAEETLINRIDAIIDKSIGNNQHYIIEMVKGDLVLIINTSFENCSMKVLENMFQNMRFLIQKELHIDIGIGVGKVYNDICDIKRSYLEALAACDYRLIKGWDRILFFDEMADARNMVYWYPAQQLIWFAQCIKQGNIYLFEDIINEIIHSIKEKNVSIAMTRSICFGMINTIIEILNELNIEDFEKDIEALISFDSLDDFHLKMKDTVLMICEYINEKKESHNEALKIAIIDYINCNYTNDSLSLELIAEKFHLTVQYLSKFFKQQLGINYVEYLKSLRINHAKKMLSDTDKSIKDIMVHVGYNDLANFTRMFKKIEGITPGEYRKLVVNK